MNSNIYPNRKHDYDQNVNVSNEIFGNRFHIDQSLYEYLIEFLLIYVSPKRVLNGELVEKMQFHDNDDLDYSYYAETMIGLRRFIFYDMSKKDSSIELDEVAYNKFIDVVKSKMEFDNLSKEKAIEAIQDLLRGYSVVLKKRSWCAQQLLPLCPEMVFCDAMPNKKKREAAVKKEGDTINCVVDNSFQFTQRNFLARGGEIYYLHILQALVNDDSCERRNNLSKYLNDLLTNQSTNISKLLRFLQDSWYEYLNVDDTQINKMYQKYSLGYIPISAYEKSGNYTVDELINYLSSDFLHIKKIEVLSKGIMFQIMRMMYEAICKKIDIPMKPWIIDMSNNSSKAIKQIASQSYRNVEDDFKNAILQTANIMSDKPGFFTGKKTGTLEGRIREGQKESLDIFKSKGKEIRCIIPIKGSLERFTLSEDLVRFIVLSLLKPGEKITYNMFLDRIYSHYGIVVGPTQYELSHENLSNDQLTIKNSLYENEIYFQGFLKATGFLTELSDSTSLVVNPYDLVSVE